MQNNKILIPEKLVDKIKINICGANNVVIIDDSVKITDRGGVFITMKGNDNCVKIDKDCTINHQLALNFFPAGIGAVSDNCSIKLGSDTFINGATQLFCGEKNTHITIGKNCLFANNIRMTTSDSHSIIDMNTSNRTNIPGNIEIGDRCWICEDVKILNNSFIGSDCVVATMALVTNFKNKSNNCVIGGVPAKIIREGITWDKTCIGNNNDATKNEFSFKNVLNKIRGIVNGKF